MTLSKHLKPSSPSYVLHIYQKKVVCYTSFNGILTINLDPSLFNWSLSCHVLYFLAYVNDFILTTSDFLKIEQFIFSLQSCFLLKKLGKLNFFLCIEVVPTPKGVFLFQ